MPHLLDGTHITSAAGTDTCPICEKKKGQCQRKDKSKTKSEDFPSKPEALGCKPITTTWTDMPHFTTAAHHVIPVNQCLNKLRRLVQICHIAGYDPNDKANGKSLPTVGQMAENAYGEDDKKYGKLDDASKELAAFAVMKHTGLQWHVGHHQFEVPVALDTDKLEHPESYDLLVQKDLASIEEQIIEEGEVMCSKEKDDRETEIIEKMNALSARIGSKIVGWKKYFVSVMSMKYADKHK